MDKFVAFLHTAWTDFLSWFGVEEQKIASFLYPIFQDAKKLVESDVMKDIIAGVPVVGAALIGGPAAALTAAEGVILPLLKTQGIELEQSTVGALSNALVAQATAAQAAVTAGTTPGAAA